MRLKFFLAAIAICVAAGSFLLFYPNRDKERFGDSSVLAATSSSSAAQYFQATEGGMAQYGYALQQSTSPSQTLQALAEWNTYVSVRSEWLMSSTLVQRLAVADWNARQAGAPTITPEQLATAATNLINAKLSTMTAEQQLAGFKAMMVVDTPKGSYGPNADYEHVSGTQNPDGTWRVTVSPQAFSERKTDFAQLAPGMVSSSTNFYPGEAVLVLYSVAADDPGFGGQYVAILKDWLERMTGLDMSNRVLYGENGFAARRPLTTFLTEESMSQLFSELGF
ncbi:MAG: hypothetical protein ACE5G6_02885 [Terriglobia bacterium]